MTSASLQIRSLAAVVLGLVVIAGCGGDDDATEPADPSTTGAGAPTSAPAGAGDASEGLARYEERGPHGVGSQQVALADGRRVVIWYPAVAGAGEEEPTDTFDIASLLNEDLQAQIPAEFRVQYPVAAASGAEPDPSAGPYPVVLFSHGFAGFPEQSVDLTTHLASWGHIVVAPDHVERSLGGLLGTAAQGVEPLDDTEVLAQTLELVLAAGESDDSPLAGMVDSERVAAAGHSAGAGATYRLASEGDVELDAALAYSLGRGREGTALPEPGDVPTFVMLGEEDGIIEADATREVYETLPSPKYLAELAGHGHLVFSDLCLIGGDQGGLIGIVEEIGLDIPDNLKRLGSDGCEEDDPPVEEAFPALNALTVAFLRAQLDGDPDATTALAAGPVEGLSGSAEVTLTVG